jgi:hypothetical protein
MLIQFTGSVVQIGLSFALEPFLWIWSIMSSFALASIIFYEIYFLELSFYDEEQEGD